MEDESAKARQKYDAIVSLIAGDSTSLGLLKELVDSARRYVEHLGRIREQRDEVKKRSSEREDSFSLSCAETLAELEETRSRYHKTLTSNLAIFNRYLSKNYPSAPIEGICLLPDEIKEQRYVSAEWAKSLITCLEK